MAVPEIYRMLLAVFFAWMASCALAQENGDLRLAGYGSSVLAGRLEVFYNGEWGVVCDERFDIYAAIVACRQLGLGHPIYDQPSPRLRFGAGSGPVLLEEVICHGNESHLLRCVHREIATPTATPTSCSPVAIACSNVILPYSGQVRLSGGIFPSSGVVEVNFHHQWAPLCSSGFSMNEADSVCRQLGFTEASSFTPGNDPGPFWLVEGSCDPTRPCFTNCLGVVPVAMETSCPAGSTSVIVNCTYSQEVAQNRSSGSASLCTRVPASIDDGSVRLQPGGSMGRVEIYVAGEWGTICDSDFSYLEADVVCKELGFPGALRIHSNSEQFGSGSGQIYTVSCSGLEDHLMECTPASVAPSSFQCNHNDDVGVECSSVVPPYGSLALRGGAGSAGTLLVFRGECPEPICHADFEPICDANFGMDEARVACRELGYEGATAVRKNTYYGPMDDDSTTPFTFAPVCQGDESHLLACPRRSVEHGACRETLDEVGVQCFTNIDGAGLVRLDREGSSGILEVMIDGWWGTVCGTQFDHLAAHVACRELNYSTAITASSGLYGPGDGPIQLGSVICTGFEESLWDCHLSLEDGSCTHNMDVGIQCSDTPPIADGTLRLANSSDNSSGRLEIAFHGLFMTVCGQLFQESAAVVACKQLGFDTAEYCTNACFGSGSGYIHFAEYRCTGNEASLLECGYEIYNSALCDHFMDLGIVCGTSPTSTSTGTSPAVGPSTRNPQPSQPTILGSTDSQSRMPSQTTTPHSSNMPTDTLPTESSTPVSTLILHIPELYFYVGVGIVAFLLLALIVAVTCCVVAFKKKKQTNWQPRQTAPERVDLGREREGNVFASYPAEKAGAGVEDFDDPELCEMETFAEPPPNYDELDFLPPHANGTPTSKSSQQ